MTEDLQLLREKLVARLLEHGPRMDDRVASAMRTVPRHVFLPELAPESVYRDDAIVIRRDAEGRPISSSSQPAIMAVMLDQLSVRPGQRVLEIGAGTGYNAALLAQLAGPSGEVVTVDIDPEVVAGARANLAAADCPQVTVVCSDGAEGFAARAPYDRIIATVGVWDLAPAWLEQLAPAGRIVVPLALRGVQRSVAFERADGFWSSTSVRPCGFMRMRGPAAGPDRLHVLDRETEHTLTVPHDSAIDLDAIRSALSTAGVSHPTGVAATTAELFDDVNVWLALHEPRWCLMTSSADAPLPSTPVPVPQFHASVGIMDANSLALLAPDPRRPGELTVLGFGPERNLLTLDLTRHVRNWDRLGRPGFEHLRIDAYSQPTDVTGGVIIDKTHTRLRLSW